MMELASENKASVLQCNKLQIQPALSNYRRKPVPSLNQTCNERARFPLPGFKRNPNTALKSLSDMMLDRQDANIG